MCACYCPRMTCVCMKILHFFLSLYIVCACYCTSIWPFKSTQSIGFYFTSTRKIMDWLTKYENDTELYTDAQRRWPSIRSRPGGKWILASFDDESIVVYQAYNNDIAQFACENGHFIGCPGYNQQRMTCKIESVIVQTSLLFCPRDQNEFSLDDVSIELGLAFKSTTYSSYLASTFGVR